MYRDRDCVVIDLALLEVGIGAEEFDVVSFVSETTTVLDYLLQAHSHVTSCSDSTFGPWCVDKLVAIAWVVMDLLNAACTAALKGDRCRHARELAFILEFREGDLPGFFDKTFDLEKILVGIDLWDAAMVSDVMILVWGDLGLLMLAQAD